ncbi:class I SAM-dependent DNA methyltransferase [Coleofasciculus sp. H7-2]|uniref:HsdM family class I SAM-dependent methyltransferase n=1 Tax=Coleofasciculus sp. H7-2 TaxID=3351545 RepID=UPI003671E743
MNENFGIDLLRRHWRTLWDFIWSGTLEDNKKFENFNKVLLAKVYDERKTKKGTAYVFQRKFKSSVPQSDVELAGDIDLLYRRAYREYLSKDQDVELKDINGIDLREFPPYLVAKCVELLCAISFQKNRYKNVDVLGEFYEMVIRDAFKQTKGLFLTHPNIVLFLLTALQVDELVVEKLRYPDQDARYRLPFVIDPSCGTGTFLVHYMQFVQKLVNENYTSIAQGDDDVTDFIQRQMLGTSAFKWVIDYVYGMDNEQVLATACQINMILHGDGSTNVYSADGLESFAHYAQMDVTGGTNILSSKQNNGNPYYSKSTIDRFDVVISNPPFNVNVNSAAVQPNFEIKGKSEAYFLERWYQLLKPGGRLGVVLPESFFAVENDVNGRLFLYKHFNIKAIVSIPNFAFSPHTTTSTSLLLASKKTVSEETDFQDAWVKSGTQFDDRFNRFTAMLPALATSINFDAEDADKDNSIKTLLHEATAFLDKEFGHGFVILPYFTDTFLSDSKNYALFKKKVRAVAAAVRERWILHQVTATTQGEFYNLAVANVGYKAGKKGSKDKPNELTAIYDANDKRIYNLKYSHAWQRIDVEDKETALGILKGLNLWQ